MPLLQGQPFRLIKPLANLQPDQEVYTIQHTGEKFIGKSDYEDRLALYSQGIWSCQCTGKSGLTHQEAWTSEQKVRVQLEGSFPAPLRGPILSIVHQSTAPLDQLVEAANHHCNGRFHRGEELELKSPQPIKVKVVRVHKGKGDASPQKPVPEVNGNPIGSPENAMVTNGSSTPGNSTLNGNGNGIAENGCSSSSSPNDGMKGKEESPGKKMLPYLYDVAIIGDDRTVTEVPAEHLQRVTKIPPKEHFRLFVRANAIRPRASSTTPWMVKEDLVKQYNIPCKLPSIFNMKPQPQKRKAEEPLAGEIVKKPKEDIKSEPSVEVKPKPVLSPIQITESSEQKIKKKPGPKLGSKHSPKKVEESGEPNNPKKRGPKPGSKRTPKMDLTSYFTKAEDGTVIKVENGSAPGSAPGMSPKTKAKGETTEKKKGRPKMKQASLFDIKTTNKNTTKSQQGSLKKSPVKKRAMTAEAVMNLPIMRKLVHEHKHLKGVKGSGRKLVYTMDLAIKKLNREQMLIIPNESLREDLLTRQAKVIEQKILADMSPEDKEEYLKQKSKDDTERRRLAKTLENMKVEDKNLNDLKPLPQPKMVLTPEVIPNSLFGDIVMVTEFLQCYRELLMPEEDINLSTSQLMEALAAGPNGFKATADIFCILLRTIIRDETSKNIKELKVPLRDLPVTYQTATELARQFLRRQDPEEKEKEDTEKEHKEDEEEEEEEDEYEEEVTLSDELINKLGENELFELEITEIIEMLKALCHRVMTTNAVAEFFDDLEEKLNKLNRENASIKKMKKKEILDEKERKKEERQDKKSKKLCSPKKGRGRPKGSLSPKKSPTKSIMNSFYKKPEGGEEEEDTDMASRVKRQRKTGVEKEQAKQEDRARIREERERQQQELDIKARLKYNENLVKKCEEMLYKKELVNRQQPLGLDRDHNRYWLFHDTTTGLFVEKGWADAASMYSVAPEFTETSVASSPMKHNSDDDVKEELSEDSPQKLQATRGRPKKMFIEDVDALTIPTVGQNLWFHFNTMEEVDALIDSLADKGHRESPLKEALIKNKDKIEANLLQKWEPLGEEDLQDGRQQIMATVKDDIIQIEREVIEGWFGAVPNYDEWEKKTNEAETIQELGERLMEVQKHMQKKFFKNFMKPMHGVMTAVVNAETDQQIGELEEAEPRAVQRWRTEVENCQTFSRLHMLVGMFDSCIRWEKSMATKKCKICRSKDKSDPLVLCDKCEGSYHWYCLRPQLWEEPASPWFCSGCAPKKSKRVEGTSTRPSRNVKEEVESDSDVSEEEEIKQEEVCRICVGRMGLIFCSTCPAAYHSECHDPPLTSRARKDWKCVECVKNPPKPKPERKANSIARFFEKGKSKKRQSWSMDDSDEELDRKPSKRKSKSKSSKQTKSGRTSKRAKKLGDDSDEDEEGSQSISRRSSRNPSKRKRYLESEEESDSAEEEEEEQEVEEAVEEEEEEGDEEAEGEEEDDEGEEKEDNADEKEDQQGDEEEEAEQEEQDDDKEAEDVENEEEEKEDDDGEDEEEDEDEGANEESEQSNATSDED